MNKVGVLLALMAAFFAGSSAAAQTIPDGATPAGLPPALRGVEFAPRLEAQMPLQLAFRDETGRDVHLSNYFGRQPVVLAFVYYGCPMLCNELERGLVGALKMISFNPAREYQVVFVSFDARETPDMALEKKNAAMSRFARPETAAGWHFLTGSKESITALTAAANFRFTYDEKTNLFAHGSGALVLTPDGRISRYFFGVDFPPRELRLGLVEASAGKIGTATDHALLFCFQYDPASGRYSTAILRIVRAGGLLTIAVIVLGIVVYRRRDARGARTRLQGAR
ncbi:MAG TPA: SCO family protein [Methylomirabilota bacterium]|nr:SCO family protein [Methylomirabilota bacterium]